MKSVIIPVLLLLFITLLLSGFTTITNVPPELPQNPGSGSHESNFTESYNKTTLKVDEVLPIMVSNGDYVPQEPASPLSPVTASILPVADLASNVTVGSVPLSVKFTDRSSNATSISWDVNGDGIEDSSSSEFVYVYNSAGTYNVSINATNTNGSDTKTIVGHISVSISEVGPSISIEKFTNGQDADTGTGPIIPVGSEVNWTYVVTNTGTIALTSVNVTDDIEGHIGSIGTLGVGENHTLFKSGVSTEGQYSNIGYVSAESGTDGLNAYGEETIQDGDPSHYYGSSLQSLVVIADFTTNVSSGVPPFSVMFTDLSQNATSISWDVNGDEVEDSNASEFVYVYNTSGTYDVSLTATNFNVNDVKVDTVISYFSEEVPEFPTIALPVLIVLGSMFLFQRKK
ncbi:PKD domain-containing protein [Methanococcoides alaskense]|uniref:PKD repeat protein n=1 Tax=Methanococcoides alaskense TaxID=325778 RepID=A0AA90TXM2_9EURY|nr:PKD domain-containing protein [Methanococcoides alaskense]MDA0525184.1 PKD domain-containing protein [Methanococcoides alaskense]MDR6221894.1 PKD repeat protein [Methanococcoides alaskense]